jgi:DNA-binding transcriptional MocR family regulator
VVKPNYQRVADDLREQIKSGVLGPGDQLPSTAQLQAKYAVGNNAVRPSGQGSLRNQVGVANPTTCQTAIRRGCAIHPSRIVFGRPRNCDGERGPPVLVERRR